MRELHKRILGALVTAALAAAAALPAHAGSDEMPVKVDFIFKFNIRVGPSVMVPPDLAPWYQWFPYDPNLMANPAQSTPYPHWPNPYPPADAASQKQGAMTAPQAFQRVGFPPSQVPSYWYGQ